MFILDSDIIMNNSEKQRNNDVLINEKFMKIHKFDKFAGTQHTKLEF